MEVQQMPNPELSVLLVAEHASMDFGGEASLPLYYFKLLRQRGIQAWMLVHARTRDELQRILPDDFDRIYFVPDTLLHKLLWRCGRILPDKIDQQTLGFCRHLLTQVLQRKLAKKLVTEHRINIVHEPMPISPKQTSTMFGLGAPVVIGPLCGGMDYPPAFQYMQSGISRWVERIGRFFSHAMHRLIPGKIRAEAIVVANACTRRALPHGVVGQIYELVESGVDLDIWKPADTRSASGRVRFAYLGRLVPWKAVDLLLEGFARAAPCSPSAVLEIVGDGPLRARLEARTAELGLGAQVVFHGWLSRPQAADLLQSADVVVLPSLRECGGTAILEGMALGLPVITTRWGGPAHYVDDHTGIRVKPDSREVFIAGLAEAIVRLATNQELRIRMGEAARRRVTNPSFHYDWGSKVDRMIQIYRETIDRSARSAQAPRPCG
jgi:glycosyltransferase involved in cell wall biosynthesis